jgi:hypothetical protein
MGRSSPFAHPPAIRQCLTYEFLRVEIDRITRSGVEFGCFIQDRLPFVIGQEDVQPVAAIRVFFQMVEDAMAPLGQSEPNVVKDRPDLPSCSNPDLCRGKEVAQHCLNRLRCGDSEGAKIFEQLVGQGYEIGHHIGI